MRPQRTKGAAPPHVAVQGELGNQQERPAGVLQRAIHQPVGIRKDSQLGELFGHRPDVAFVVVGADADEHQQARTDFPHVAAGDATQARLTL